jgi:hypothetical protein
VLAAHVRSLAHLIDGDAVRELVRKAVGEGERSELIELRANAFLREKLKTPSR